MRHPHRAGIAKRLPAFVLLALLLPGCSTLRVAYQQIDWFALYYVRNHVSLTDEQTERLKERLSSFRQWHCETQVEDYARWLRAANNDVQTGKLDYPVLAARYAEFERSWHRLVDESVVELSTLLPLLSDAQVAEYLGNLERENMRLRSEILEPSLPERRERIRRWMGQQLERWVGSLTPVQQQALRAWSDEVPASAAEDRMAMRAAWQQELRRVLARRGDGTAFGRQLRRLLREPEHLWPADYARYRAMRREQTMHLLVSIGKTLTPEQRDHLARRAEKWAADFDALACRKAERK